LRFIFHLLLGATLALAIGFGLSWFALTDGRLFGAMQIGPWVAWRQVGASAPDPYTRAFIARAGTLQLGQSEGLHFVATQDSNGDSLDRACRYRIEGPTPTATFWTLSALDEAGVNIARPDGEIALHSARLARNNNGQAVIYVSKTLSPYNWLEITGQGPFSLALTFYDVALFAGVGSSNEGLPGIVKESCP
jgi:hypothetical protein